MKTLSAAQKNILEAITAQTIDRNGNIKKRSMFPEYDQRTVNSLFSRGLLTFDDGNKGEGYAAKKK